MVVPNEVQPSSQSMRGRGYSRSVAQHADTIPEAARPSVIIVIDSFAEKMRARSAAGSRAITEARS
jgi:hypothetical protein